ncbi:hypothetical protein AADG42_17435 [Ammonicoccus fulvus]|uniref:Uncharacterized protein n=1 Tax=Ammonicoccus fulvus TaxID=3138240 RepID=A0ABZ3FW85_9ACTN
MSEPAPRPRWMTVALLSGSGAAFGVLTSLVNHGFGPSPGYVSKVLGVDVGWLVAGFVAAWGGRTFGRAAARAAVFLVAAVVGYYASDSALGVYASIPYDPRNPDAWDPNAEPVFQWGGVLLDLAYWTVMAGVTALLLGFVVWLIRRGGLRALVGVLVVPTFIALLSWQKYRLLMNYRLDFDPEGKIMALWTAIAAVVAAVVAVVVWWRYLRTPQTSRESSSSR